ncbi:MAG TPA: universal stress protein [Deltaproteobacteria bacterium]|nr:universal stress protein [Deltaproteobacteria bacterium]
MFENILFPTDFSDVSRKALGFVKRLIEAGGKKVTLLHVIDESNLDTLSSIYTVPDYLKVEKDLHEKASKEMGFIENELKEIGYEVTTEIAKGIPLREILRVAAKEPSSIIIIGSHGKSNIQEMLLGSVSEKVIRKAKIPVLVVKR